MKMNKSFAVLPIAASLILFSFSTNAQSTAAQKSQPSEASPEACDPPVGPIVYGDKPDPKISKRMKKMFQQDQSARHGIMSHKDRWAKLEKGDQARRVEVMRYLAEGKLASADDFFNAAMIFQHGTCADHYKLANQFSEKAMNMGNHDARWLYAASLDRYLMTLGKPQKYGTQYQQNQKTGKWELYTVDPATTDEERARYDVPPMAETQKQLEQMNQKTPH